MRYIVIDFRQHCRLEIAFISGRAARDHQRKEFQHSARISQIDDEKNAHTSISRVRMFFVLSWLCDFCWAPKDRKSRTQISKLNFQHFFSPAFRYATRALPRLNLEGSISEKQLVRAERRISEYKQVVAFCALRVLLGPVVERLILLDRICYLTEQGNIVLCRWVDMSGSRPDLPL